MRLFPIKLCLKVRGAGGLQGEFGIGLLSVWTPSEDLLLPSAGDDGRTWQMHLKKGDQRYSITQRPALFAEAGTDVLVKGIPPDQLLERLLELTLYTEENLR